jgi:hypothetical protein
MIDPYQDWEMYPTDEEFCEECESEDLPEMEVLRRIHAKESVSPFDTHSQHVPYFSLMHTRHTPPRVRPMRPTS